MRQYQVCHRLISCFMKTRSMNQIQAHALSTHCSAQPLLQHLIVNNSWQTLLHPFEAKSLQLATLTPMAQSVRHGGKPNTRRPKIPHKERAVMLAITNEKYKYPLEGLPPTETCINAVKEATLSKQKIVSYSQFGLCSYVIKYRNLYLRCVV